MPSDDHLETYQLFCYGTLMVPAILLRVLGRKGEDLTFQDAILHGYTRHHVKNADYPGLIDSRQARDLGWDAGDDATRGTLISGLTEKDMHLLDIFEGDEYERVEATVATLSKPTGLADLPPELAGAKPRTATKETGSTTACVYVWSAPVSRLESAQWSFDEFLRDKAKVWAGAEAEYADVDAARFGKPDADGLVGRKVKGFPDFGANMRQYFPFSKTYVNVNHGSYGTPPLCVIEAKEKLSRDMDSRIDFWMKRKVAPLLKKTREQVAPLMNAEVDEVVIVPNTTHGINTVTYNTEWADGDIIIVYASTYNAVSQTMKHVCDTHPNVRLEVINVTFPCLHSEIVAETEAVLKKYNKPTGRMSAGDAPPTAEGVDPKERVRMVVVDAIASVPGVAYPWEDIVRLCHQYGALSLVDGAHAIGQYKIDVKRSDPDFFVTNMHKWLMTGSAMCVPFRNQRLIRTSFPTGHFYESEKYPERGYPHKWTFVEQFDWNGTLDFTPNLTVPVALKFRQDIGGEERIMAHNHSMAVAGGKRLAKRWGTGYLENEKGELTVNMVNVETPLPKPQNDVEAMQIARYCERVMLDNDTHAPTFLHNGKWYARFSAQVWTELSDFDYVADVFDKIKAGIKRGEHMQ